ncbi:hypothetical protein BJ138DRAFT_855593 [Hygrophoropsis aurantiaca]|uniref:Uncharacterized protein n=1 Tax=Hygrophoropsis aurantiaca TaxID=72124 RepID=A0ACB8AFI8_9AGAM|nr:hypothetical protein BJ138DRAFT_855593 [Hygrophoropsis aurantiaca]
MSYYPLHWLSTTFSTRQRTAELLQPEVEKNVLSPHDFDLAASFLPGIHRHWPAMYSSGIAGATFGFGYYYARPRWSPGKLSLVTGIATMAGLIYGQARQLFAHRQFTQSLVNPKGFMTALMNVDRRLGGDGNLGFTLERIRSEDLDQKNETRDNEMNIENQMVGEDNWDITQKPSNPKPESTVHHQSSQSAESSSRWEEIRELNKRNAGQQSSWDTIRQQHERRNLSAMAAQRESGTKDPQDERALDQAKFDAMVEAERRNGISQDAKDTT